jgi:ABC-type transporter Mla subunit MlaD
MSDIREDAVRALEAVADALKDAQRALQAAERAARRALKSETRGVPTAAVLRATPVADYRPNVDEALTNLERARHRVLVANFRVALDDGMTVGELSRNYGFSRQLASRYAKEARGDHESSARSSSS